MTIIFQNTHPWDSENDYFHPTSYSLIKIITKIEVGQLPYLKIDVERFILFRFWDKWVTKVPHRKFFGILKICSILENITGSFIVSTSLGIPRNLAGCRSFFILSWVRSSLLSFLSSLLTNCCFFLSWRYLRIPVVFIL